MSTNFKFYDSCGDTSATTGSGTLTLAGVAPTGYVTITGALSNADKVYYRIQTADGTSWEVGKGTYTTSGTTLSRDTIIASSNSGSAVNFGSGTKNVYIVTPKAALLASVLSVAGDIGYHDGTALAKLAIGGSNSYLTVISGVPAWVANATGQSTPGNQGAITSTTDLMNGCAGSITPVGSGKVVIIISGDALCSNATGIVKLQIHYGTNTAPTNGAASTGTAVGGQIRFEVTTNSQQKAWSLNAIVSGLVASTAYWIDVAVQSSAGSVTLESVSISAFEL